MEAFTPLHPAPPHRFFDMTTPPLRLTLVIPAITAGGAERVMVILANEWAKKNWQVTLLTLDDGQSAPFFTLDHRINWQALDVMGVSGNAFAAMTNNLKRLATLRSAIDRSQPDAVISFLDTTNVLTLLATRGLGLPIIVSERIDIGSQPIHPLWGRLRNWMYPFAAALVVLTERTRQGLLPSLQSRCRVIPNPVLPPSAGIPLDCPLPKGPKILAMGRLCQQKGFDLLLEAFASIRAHYPEWSLVIIGEGPLRDNLQARSDQSDLAGAVHLPGHITSTATVLQQCDLFVLPSRLEGFPNALGEAMAAGLPVIAADCPTGPREMIQAGHDGLLVPMDDIDALASAMTLLMADAKLRHRLGNAAQNITLRFGLPEIMSLWESTLFEVSHLDPANNPTPGDQP
jgi:glycosyltransferase involved in cell wall biosynthesis